MINLMFCLLLLLTTCVQTVFAVPVSSTDQQEQFCSSPVCQQSAQFIADSLNVSVDPCEDFYSYSCGGWLAKHRIPDTRTRLGVFDELKETMRRQVKDLLEHFDWSRPAPESVYFAAYLYQKCMQVGQDGLRQLKEVVTAELGRNWDIGSRLKGQQQHPLWHDTFSRVYVGGYKSPFFKITIAPDPKNVTKNIINIQPPRLGLPDNELRNLHSNPKLITAYKDYIRKAARLFCGADCSALESDIADLVNLESALARAKTSPEEQQNPERAFHKTSIRRLNDKTHFDWLNKIFVPTFQVLGFPQRLTESTVVRVFDLDYIIRAIAILQKAPHRTTANLVGWRVVAANGPRSAEQFRRFAFDFDQVHGGVKKQRQRWERCFDIANSQLPMAVSRLFIEKYYSPEEKAEAVQLVDSIQQSYRQSIQYNTWLDAATRAISLDKLDHVTKNVGYPEWLLIDGELDELYSLSNVTFARELLAEENYLLALLRYNLNRIRTQVGQFDRPNSFEKRWPMAATTINAAYAGNQNSITIPAALLKFPFFSTERPFALNYAFIGVVVAHEFTHGLDNNGRMFDAQGNLQNWWTDEAARRFYRRSECFVQQYGRQVEPVTGLRKCNQLVLRHKYQLLGRKLC